MALNPSIKAMANSYINTSVSGTNVTITVTMGAGDRLDWWIRVTSKYDYGYGKGQGVGDYPWIVEIIDGTTATYTATKTYKPGLYSAELNIMGVGPVDFSLFEIGATGATHPEIYDILTIPNNPAAGASFTIKAQIANTGYNGKVRAVFKVNGTQISDQNSTLNTFPGGGLWEPTIGYTMPNATITISVDAYGWDGTKWVLTHTGTRTRTPSAISCTGVSITPFAASLKAGEKVTFTASVTPSTTAYDVQFKDRAGTVLGTCKTSGGSCNFIWDSAGKAMGTYYVKASVAQGNCVSTESTILVSPAINQWNVNIQVNDSVTNVPVGAATVTAGTQSKQTDAAGYVQFRVTEGTINITISKTGYNTFTTAEYVFSDKTVNYPLSPVGIATGNIQFVSVPSNAEIFMDDVDQGFKTPFTVTDIPAGVHTFALKLAGFNDTAGSVTVVGGSTIPVYAELSLSTPNTGSLYIASFPGDAEIFIDGADQGVKTPTTITNLPPGSHTVKLVKTGYADFTGQATITAGTTEYLSAALTILPGIGTLEISSKPPKARVFVDGTDTQKETSATITNLTSGDHTYKLVLSGYQEATGTFTIESGQTKTVSVLMAKTAEGIGTGTIIGLGLLGAGVLGAVILTTKETKYLPPKTR